MRRLAIFVTIFALGGCAHAPVATSQAMALDPLLAFSDPSRCEQSPIHARLLKEMFAGDAENGFRPGKIVAAQPFGQAFGPIFVKRVGDFTVVGATVRGTLFGLPLVSIEQAFPNGGDPGEVTYTFETTVPALERQLVARGFPAKAGKTVSMGPPEVYDHVIQVLPDRSHRGRAMFLCGYQ